MNKNKIIGILEIFLVGIFYITVVIFICGCSVSAILEEAYTGEDNGMELPKVEIDEEEISEIGKVDMEGEKSYDIEEEISLIAEPVRDPFKPFYINEEQEEKENIIKLERIYQEDGIEYAEISLNDNLYLLAEGDPLTDIYLVHAINPDSVVLMKGDVILQILIGEVVYD